MEKKFSKYQILVIFTAFLAFLLFSAGVVKKTFFSPTAAIVSFSEGGNPRLGVPDAPVHIVLIEDFHCSYCRQFTVEIFPKIEKRYVATQKASFLFVPVSFLSGSRPLANACLSVFHLAPQKFIPYLHALFDQFAEDKDLVPLAKKIGGINLSELQKCIDTGCYYAQLKENYIWAKELMGPNFGTPALFINGEQVNTSSWQDISEAIEKHL